MIGMILEGGGMRAGFVAGALMALMDKGLVRFDCGLAVSASVPTLAYFASGQREEMERVWRNELSTPRFICYRNLPATFIFLSNKSPVLNLDYLVFDIFRKKYPLKLNTLLKSDIRCFFALTRMPEGELTLIEPADNDIYKTFKAAMAVPGCYPEAIRLNGDSFVDGGTVDLFPVEYLIRMGCRRIMAVLSTPLNCRQESLSLLEKTLFWRYFQKYDWIPKKFQEASRKYNEQVAILERMAVESPSRALIIHPDRMPPAKFITRDHRKINRTIDLGYKKIEEVEDRVKRFLQMNQAR